MPGAKEEITITKLRSVYRRSYIDIETPPSEEVAEKLQQLREQMNQQLEKMAFGLTLAAHTFPASVIIAARRQQPAREEREARQHTIYQDDEYGLLQQFPILRPAFGSTLQEQLTAKTLTDLLAHLPTKKELKPEPTHPEPTGRYKSTFANTPAHSIRRHKR